MSKAEVRSLADSLLDATPEAVETCVRFVCAETVGLWHGRGRAMMCRRMKHMILTPEQQHRLVGAILGRLISGTFSEQFRDQLRLVIRLDPIGTFALARHAATSEKTHVRRFAEWVLAHEGRESATQSHPP
jgi:hypothetical protein